MKTRRAFISGMGGVAAAWPLAARGQQAAVPVIGFINSGTAAANTSYMAILRRVLNEAGYVEGRNVTIEFRWAETRAERIPALVADLVQRRVAVIFATGG